MRLRAWLTSPSTNQDMGAIRLYQGHSGFSEWQFWHDLWTTPKTSGSTPAPANRGSSDFTALTGPLGWTSADARTKTPTAPSANARIMFFKLPPFRAGTRSHKLIRRSLGDYSRFTAETTTGCGAR